MTNPAEVARLKALLTQATPTGAPIPELVQALAEYLAAWHQLAPEGVARVMAEQAAEIDRLKESQRQLVEAASEALDAFDNAEEVDDIGGAMERLGDTVDKIQAEQTTCHS